MDITLMTDVEYKPVPRGVEYPVNGDRQLHCPEI